MAGKELTEDDLEVLHLIELKVQENVNDKTFNKLKWVFQLCSLPSFKVSKQQLTYLAQFGPQQYDCCIASCICYAGLHKEKTQGKWRPSNDLYIYSPHPTTCYTLSEPQHVKLMRYQHEFKSYLTRMHDIFDGFVYQGLKGEKVTIGGVPQRHRFFKGEDNIALGIATDSFAPFK